MTHKTYYVHEIRFNGQKIGIVVVTRYKMRDRVVIHMELPKRQFEQTLLFLSRWYAKHNKTLYADNFPLVKK